VECPSGIASAYRIQGPHFCCWETWVALGGAGMVAHGCILGLHIIFHLTYTFSTSRPLDLSTSSSSFITAFHPSFTPSVLTSADTPSPARYRSHPTWALTRLEISITPRASCTPARSNLLLDLPTTTPACILTESIAFGVVCHWIPHILT